tara:strand:- start:74 stop:1540 length:1467 start_codon:yes stop_codon:yes gene_type:complete
MKYQEMNSARFDRQLLLLWSAVFLIASTLIYGPAWSRGAPDSFADLVDRLSPAVVNISTTQKVKSGGRTVPLPKTSPGSPFEEFFKEFFEERQLERSPRRNVTSLGSGFIIDSAGIIITNNHVIAEADEITVILSDDTELEAEIIGRDERTDLAVLKVDAERVLPSVRWGDSELARVGDWVLAIGNPFGLGGSVTAGIISARGRDINAGPYDDFIQTDAPINRGNSGGPLFGMDGYVIGVNSAIFSPSGGSIGIGFSIPSSLARPIVEQLRKYGRVRRGWLGVRIQTVTEEIAEGMGLDEARGALVASIINEDDPAHGRIEPGDIILSFDGVTITDVRSLSRTVADTPVGKTVKVEVWRRGSERTIYVTISELTESKTLAAVQSSKPESAEIFGMSLAQLTEGLRRKYGVSDQIDGVVVTSVDPNSRTAQKGIQEGDVITEVSQQSVRTLSELIGKIEEVERARRKSVVLTIIHRGELRFVAIRIEGD